MKKLYNRARFPSGKWGKPFLLTNLKLLLLFCFAGTTSANPLLSQQTTYSIAFENETLGKVINDLKTRTGYNFTYNRGSVNESVRVTANMNNATIEQILDRVLGGNGYAYEIDNRVVFVSRQQTQGQQQRPGPVTVTGYVRDSEGQPVIGAAVIIKGQHVGTSTDTSGAYSMVLREPDDVVLIYSYVGKKTVEIVFNRQTRIDVTLEDDVAEVDEVIVTGIFTRTRESNTGATRTITSEELRRSSNRSVITAIANIDPSFKIDVDLVSGSNPNALPSITMRGNSSMPTSVRDIQNDSEFSGSNLPLFLKDGFEISLSQMRDIDENTVESITLLKDASATAIYGTRGANGVVVITTRRPPAGKLRMRYAADLSIEAPDLSSYNMMNAMEKLEFERRVGVYSSSNPGEQQRLNELWNERYTDAARGVDTYWLNYPIRTGVGHKHRLELEGGSQEFRFTVNVGYNDIQGAMKESFRKTTNGGLTFLYLKDNLTFTNNLEVYENNSQESPYGTFNTWVNMNPYFTPYDEEGNIKKYLQYGQVYRGDYFNGSVTQDNPFWNASLPSRNEGKYTNITNNFAVQWYITPDLFLRANLGYSNMKSRSDLYLSKEHSSFRSVSTERRGSYTQGYGETKSYDARATLNYGKLFNGVHNLYAGISYNVGQSRTENNNFSAEGISNPEMDYITMASAYALNSSPQGSESVTRRIGGVANVNYSYKGKYYADLSGNIEGSSRFGSRNRTAPFWSAGIGWNLHQENFLKGNDIVTYAKLRLSYGTSGSQNFNPYQSMMTYKDYGSVHYGGWSGAYLLALGNDELGWQKTGQLNIGGEVEFWNRRLQIIFNLYRKLTDDLLADITIPSAGGFTSYMANVGKIQNKGFELNLTGAIIRDDVRRISWQAGVNISYNKNTIKKISDSLEALNRQLLSNARTSVNPSFLYEEGQSSRTIFAVKSMGIDPANGKELFLKRDGTITYDWSNSDMVPCGVNDPKFWGNINTLFRYKDLAFNAIFRFAWGGQRYNSTLANKVENISFYNNLDKRALYDRWYYQGDQSYFKKIDDKTTTRATSRFVMDDNYISLSSMSLTYDLYGSWLRNLGLESMSVGAYTEEMFVAASIKLERGTSYPFARKFSMKLTLRF